MQGTEAANEVSNDVMHKSQPNEPVVPAVTVKIRIQRILQRVRGRSSETVVFGAMAVLLGVSGWAAYANVAKSGWTADAAGWAQAAGSIIAIAGAIWLSRSEARHARRSRRELAEETIWSVRFVIVQAQFDSHIIAAELTNEDEPYVAADIRSWRQRSDNASLALQTMLARTDYIHSSIVLMTCNAKILIDGLSTDLDSLTDALQRNEVPTQRIVGDIVFAHANLANLLELYDARVEGIRQALDRGGDQLPLDEWRARRA